MGDYTKHYVGLDVSTKRTAVCIVDDEGNIIDEVMVETEPEAIDSYLRDTGMSFEKLGIESTNLAIWLCRALIDLGYDVICAESHQTAAFMSAQRMKTDRNDARGIAQMMRCGMYKPVHIKSDENQRLKMLVNNRRFLVEQRVDIENQIRGSLKTFGLKIGDVNYCSYERTVRRLIEGDGELEIAISPLLNQRANALCHIKQFDQLLRSVASNDPVCRLLMSAPGIGPLTAILYKAVIDDPHRFKRSKDVPSQLGLVPRKHASGEMDYNGGITKAGDFILRHHLYKAAESLMKQSARANPLKEWGRTIQKRRSYKVSRIAVARKLSIILHRMWQDGTPFDWGDRKEHHNQIHCETDLRQAV